jgi:hypothetical protein
VAQTSQKDRWWIPLVVGLIAFVGSALGSALPRLAFEGEEAQKRLIEARINTYNDFFKGQALLIKATSKLEEGKEEEANVARDQYSAFVKEAKFRIGVYGTKPEVEAITDYFRKYLKYPPCNGPRQKWLDDIKTYQQIRNGVFREDSKQRVDDARLVLLLFDCQLPDEVAAR